MNSDSEAATPFVATGSNDTGPSAFHWTASLKYLLLIVAVGNPYASAFLFYPLPNVSGWLWPFISLICWFFIFFISVGVLMLRRWTAVAIFAAGWIWLFFGPSPGPGGSTYWLMKQGFRVHASPVKDYLSKCELVEFTEGGTQQTVGFCEGTEVLGVFDALVYYDTTGEFSLPLSQRTPEWKQAMSKLARDEVLELRGDLLFGNFYRVEMPLEQYRG